MDFFVEGLVWTSDCFIFLYVFVFFTVISICLFHVDPLAVGLAEQLPRPHGAVEEVL